FAWIIGWDLILEYAMSGAVVASGWSNYFNSLLKTLFNWEIPYHLLNDPFTSNAETGTYLSMNVPAVFIMVLITAILVIGIRESATTNTIMVAIKVTVVIFVIAVGWHYINPANWTDVPVTERIQENPENPEEKWGILALIGLNQWLVPLDNAT